MYKPEVVVFKNKKKMNQIKLFGLTCLFLCFLSCGQTSQKKDHTIIENGWKSIDENSFSVQYPEKWDMKKSGQMGVCLIFLSKQTSPQDKFRENVNVLIQDLSGKNIDLDKYVEISEEQIKTMITNGKLLESKRLSKNGSEFQKVIYTGEEGIYKLKFEQYYLIKNDKAYVITLTCELDQFDAYKTIGEKILNSFQLN
jgi:hypothetical protein